MASEEKKAREESMYDSRTGDRTIIKGGEMNDYFKAMTISERIAYYRDLLEKVNRPHDVGLHVGPKEWIEALTWALDELEFCQRVSREKYRHIRDET